MHLDACFTHLEEVQKKNWLGILTVQREIRRRGRIGDDLLPVMADDRNRFPTCSRYVHQAASVRLSTHILHPGVTGGVQPHKSHDHTRQEELLLLLLVAHSSRTVKLPLVWIFIDTQCFSPPPLVHVKMRI